MKIEVGGAYLNGEGSLVLVFEEYTDKRGSYPEHTQRAVLIKSNMTYSVESYTPYGMYHTRPNEFYDLKEEALDSTVLHFMASIDMGAPTDGHDFWLNKYLETLRKRNENEATK